MTARPRTTLRALAVLALLAALPAAAAPKPKGAPARHVDTQGEQECAACHRTDTPEVFKAWEGSPHGLALVKCVVCHGSTGADFQPRPAATQCQGCHAVQVASLAKRAVKDCFACHAPHTLKPNPHR